MKTFLSFSLFALSFTLFLSGCISLDTSAKKDEETQIRSALSEEVNKVKQEINSLKGEIDELKFKIQKTSQMQSQQSVEINATLKEFRREIENDTERKITVIEPKIESIEKKQTQDKKELQDKINIVVEEVSKENAELRKEIDSLRKTQAQSVYTAQEGYYTVAVGDTLSKIAQRFGISVKGIMEANNITDPNSIHPGQKILIPEKK